MPNRQSLVTLFGCFLVLYTFAAAERQLVSCATDERQRRIDPFLSRSSLEATLCPFPEHFQNVNAIFESSFLTEEHLLGECIRCSRKFKAHSDSDRKDMTSQFDAHVCSVEDVRRTGTRIVSRAGLSFFSS